jgi:formylglycine-generating enzyme
MKSTPEMSCARITEKSALLAIVLAMTACEKPSTTPTYQPVVDASGLKDSPSPAMSESPKPVGSGSKETIVETAREKAKLVPQREVLKGAGEYDSTPTRRSTESKSCPGDMVDVKGQFCIDRYEGVIFDKKESRRVSPFYHPSYIHSKSEFESWQTLFAERATPQGLTTPIPQPEAWQLQGDFDVIAVSKAGVLPNGHLNGTVAEKACKNVGKRLCTQAEWVKACKGEGETQFPYGDTYVAGKCNINHAPHPISLLHEMNGLYLNDPRLNRLPSYLEKTGARPTCASRWGNDAVYDMAGNLDEWVDDPKGRFSGGFYSRASKKGCDQSISAHPRAYYDYSLGVRCCRDAVKATVTP